MIPGLYFILFIYLYTNLEESLLCKFIYLFLGAKLYRGVGRSLTYVMGDQACYVIPSPS